MLTPTHRFGFQIGRLAPMGFDQSEFDRLATVGFSAEIKALLYLLDSHFAAQQAPIPETLNVDPARFLDLARLNKVSGFASAQLGRLGLRNSAIAAHLQTTGLRTLALNRSAVALGVKVTDMFNKARIRHVHLKGPLQQIALYGQPAMKPSGDIDLLIAPADRQRAENLLVANGFYCTGGELSDWWSRYLGEKHFQSAAGGPVVDLHHHLRQPGSPSPLQVEQFLKHVEDFVFEQTTYLVPCPINRCLLAAINVVKAIVGREPCAGNVADLKASLSLLNPKEQELLVTRARAQNLVETLGLGLQAVDALFCGKVPPCWAEIDNPLPDWTPQQLQRLLVSPWDKKIIWPRRRTILWALSGRSLYRFLPEAGHAIGSELYRRAAPGVSNAARRLMN